MPAALTLLARTRRRVRSASDGFLLLRVVVVFLVLPLFSRLPTMAMLRWLERLGRCLGVGRRRPADDVVAMSRACGSLHWWSFQDNCVSQSLALFTLLNRPDAPLDVVFGVAAHDSVNGVPQLGRRHVWLEQDGTAVHEREPVDQYVVQMRYRTRLAERRSPGAVVTVESSLGALGVSSVGTALSSVASVVRTKIVAVVLGPAGVGVAGQVSQSMFALTWLATFGSGAGTTRYLAEALERGDERQAATVIQTAAALLAATSAVLVALGVVFASSVASWLFGSKEAVAWVWWLLPAVPAAALLSVSTSVLRGARQVSRLVIAQSVGALLAVVASYFVVRGGALESVAQLALVITATQAAAMAIAAWPVCRRWCTSASNGLSAAVARGVATYGLANVAMGMSSAVATLLIGRAYLAAGQADAAGRIAALVWFAEPLASVLVSGLHASTYPAYCAASGPAAARVLSKSVRALVIFMTPPLLIGAMLARPIVHVMFSPAFSDVAPLLGLQLLATYLRCANILLGVPLLARGRILVVTTLHLAWTTAAAAGAVSGLLGPRAYVFALLAACAAHLAALVLTLGLSRLGPAPREYGWVGAGAALIVLAVLI